MSHSGGEIKFKKDNKIMYFEYNGTADVVLPQLYESDEELLKNWRKGEWVVCNCGKGEDVEIFSSYGGGFYFDGKACRKCMAIIEPLTEDDSFDIQKEGYPDWVKKQITSEPI